MLKTMIGKWLRTGKKGKSFDTIEEGDLEAIRGYFDRSDPDILQHEVWYNLTYYFGLRGRETVSQLNMNSFSQQTDEDGRDYIFINHQTLSKNVKASLSQKEFDDLKNARMYDAPHNPSICPVTSFRIYQSRCSPRNEYLFPRPVKHWRNSSTWYSPVSKVGRDKVGEFMKTISAAAGTKKTYTNHCVRVTVVTELDAQGFTPEQISSVTGQKNMDSVNRYRRRKDAEKRKISDALTSAMTPSRKIKRTEALEESSITIRNKDPAERIVQVPRGSEIHFHFEGQFKDCTFNFNS